MLTLILIEYLSKIQFNKGESSMNTKKLQQVIDKSYQYIGIAGKKKQQRILTILKYCKEIRDTAYPMQNSLVTELELTEFTARKEKDLIYINGSLLLKDGDQQENRYFEAYIIENEDEDKIRVYMDITRLNVHDEPKMIRTNEVLVEDEHNIMAVTAYALNESAEEKIYSSEFSKDTDEEYTITNNIQQLSAI